MSVYMGVGMPSPRSLLWSGYPWYQVPSGWVYQGIYQEVYQGWGGYTRYTHPTPGIPTPPVHRTPVYLVYPNWYRHLVMATKQGSLHPTGVALSRSFVFVNCASISAFISDPVFKFLFYIPQGSSPLDHCLTTVS